MLKFQPKPGSIVFCDYKGFVKPEMVKKRPVIVVSIHKQNSQLLAVVPISTTLPDPLLYYHIEMDKKFCDLHLDGKKSWVKCDMFNVVSLDRLNLVRDRASGTRHAPKVEQSFLDKIRWAVRKVHKL